MKFGQEIQYIDFHTHHNRGTKDTVAIMNLMAGDDVPAGIISNTLFSAGIHPWNLTRENEDELKSELLLSAAHPHVMMIGEAGFDRLRGPDIDIQRRTFRFQVDLAEEMRKPLVIHCVRCWEELISARKESKPSVPWIIHGFRGRIDLAASLSEQGFYFSLGMKSIIYQTLKVISSGKIFLETDDTQMPVTDVYERYCQIMGCNAETASDLFRNNFNSLFENII